ncbi:MAG: PQQ-binding-like beta-propeller repeat protein [Acidobacteriota bacterium]
MQSSQAVRLWPAWVILALQAVAMILTITPSINNATRFYFMMLGPVMCLLLFLIWLFFASRIPLKERLLTFAGLVVLGLAAGFAADPSVRIAVWIYGIPLAMLAITVGLFIGREASSGRRLSFVLAGTTIAFGLLNLVRLGGFTGDYLPEMTWRWASSYEEVLTGVAEPGDRPATITATTDWPGFRGPERDGKAPGFDTPLDWKTSPPQEAWRISIGPGWSSFAHASGRLYTQEQRGESEVVSCYDAASGETIWQHVSPVRFNEVVAGPGPRATPTVDDGRVFALGATGLLSALDAETGRQLWQHDLVAKVEAMPPVWGFSGSPLVASGAVIVYAGGKGDHGLVAYAVATGEPAWQIASNGMNFSSAQLMRLAGQELVLFADGTGVTAIDPANGDVAWRFKPSEWGGPPIVQAQQLSPDELVVSLGDGAGVARLEATWAGGAWKVRELWSSRGLKPSFNDFVYHNGFLYGFDQNIFACVDAATGERRWKRGRYGFGQQVLLTASSQIIVITEKGELVLLDANPDEHTELARLPMLEGKTWNHPIVAEQRLIVRNGREAVSLELAPGASSVAALESGR